MTKGFTLVEILIVIALLGIIAIPVISNFATSQKRARDAVRRSDISEISNALEQYYSVCGFQYPATYTLTSAGSIVCSAPSIAIMPKIPQDPKSGSYTCTATDCNTTTYELCAVLEADKAPTPTGFCLSNRQ